MNDERVITLDDLTGGWEAYAGVEGVLAEDRVAASRGIYDLQGRRLAQPPLRGIYIKDGRKILR